MRRKVGTPPPPSRGEIIRQLRALGNPANVAGMARFGIPSDNALGISAPVLKRLAREIGRHHRLAQELWVTGIHEARALAVLIEEPERVTEAQAERWARQFDSWDICDGCCLYLFATLPFAWRKVFEWSRREREFEKRAAFALIAVLTVHDKASPKSKFLKFLPIIKREANDGRNFVKKAVNWALRQIGKQNLSLNRAAIRAAREIRRLDTPSARWIAADALRELASPAVQSRLRRARLTSKSC
jgi:3-methyladenine DNA glycosylase AlkD